MAQETPFSLSASADSTAFGDSRRAREVYRHVQPTDLSQKSPDYTIDSNEGKSAATPLKDALEPYVQLASLRCHAPRALVTLIDRETQYFLAEASKRLDVDLEGSFEKKETLAWLGCGGVSKSGNICEVTLRLPPSSDPYPILQIQDLTKDIRFAHLPYVEGYPNLRFYAGTPLTTRRGVNIGTVCIMDNKPRDGLDDDQRHFLGWLAGLVVTHLETSREVIEGRRSKLMSHALNIFVNGGKRLMAAGRECSTGRSSQPSCSPQDRTLTKRKPMTRCDRDRSTSRQKSTRNKIDCTALQSEPIPGEHHNPPKDRMTTSTETSSDEESSQETMREEDVLGDHRLTLGRAANILRECFEIEGDDGVLFLQAGSGVTHSIGDGLSRSLNQEGQEEEMSNGIADSIPISPTHRVNTNSSFDALTGAFSKHANNPANVLAASTKQEPFLRDRQPEGHVPLGDMDQDDLHDLFERYPQGKIWVLENGMLVSSSEDDQGRKVKPGPSSKLKSRSQQKAEEASMMTEMFPGARQILFVPLWDAAMARWASGCFVWSQLETRVFSATIDLGFLNSFSKTITAECSRLDTLLADKQKSDFIGSISHELRSPLHGILAGAEFLSETATSAFQRSLLDTVEACGRTLLDTINHVLDFSKINSLDRNWRNNRQPRRRPTETQIGPGAQMSAKKLPYGAPPLLRLYAVTDIAAVAEEVVEGLSIGKIYSQDADLTDTSEGNRGQGADKGIRVSTGTYKMHGKGTPKGRDGVEVVLDISKEDWMFVAQPGALRRIIMNLFENAIKYTPSGTIEVQLRLEIVPGSVPDHRSNRLRLTITDTGKGISPKFLSRRLFVPFAQENPLSPGTGLGMSTVRTIVNMIGGSIDVRSRVGVGTTVQVCLPLERPSAESDNLIVTTDDSIGLLRAQAGDCVLALYEHCETERTRSSARQNSTVLAGYIRDWYGLRVCDWADRAAAKVLIIDELDIPAALPHDQDAGLKSLPSFIVLCSDVRRHGEMEVETSKLPLTGVFHYLSKPCGPYKLARVLYRCMEGMGLLKPGHTMETLEQSLPKETQDAEEFELASRQPREPISPVEATRRASVPLVNPRPQVAAGDRSADQSDVGDKNSFASATASSRRLSASPEVQKFSNGTEPSPKIPLVLKGRQRAPRMLLVDDNKINLQLLQTFMRRNKYHLVDSAEDGSVAVDAVKAAKEPYDIIFMDISMPVMNGFEATRAIRDFEAKKQIIPAKVVALTGLASARDQAEGFAAGCDIYMTKPVSFKEVLELLKDWERNPDTKGDLDEYKLV